MVAAHGKSFDVLVVGSGAAGLSAAAAAAARGASVAVLERADVLGGTTAVSSGAMWLPCNAAAAELGYADSTEEVRRYLHRLAVGRTTPALIDAFVEEAPDAFEFLHATVGLAMDLTPQPDYQMGLPGARAGGRTLFPGLYEGRRLGDVESLVREVPASGPPPFTFQEMEDSNWGIGEKGPEWTQLLEERQRERIYSKGRALVGALVEACLERGVALRTGSRVIGLSQRGRGRVEGLEVRRGDHTEFLVAEQAVVLAAGGFEWNQRMWAGLIGVPFDGPLSPPGNEGDALLMAMRAGAGIGNVGEVWWMPAIEIPGETADGRKRLRLGAAGKSLPGAIVVNSAGKRFANESMNYNDFGQTMVAFTPETYAFPNYPSFVIFDSDHRNRYLPVVYDERSYSDAEWIASSPTVGGLAAQLGIDARGLEDQVTDFNRHAQDGADPAFQRGVLAYDSSKQYGDRTREHPNIAPLATPPFYGYRLQVSCLGTKGGPIIDGRAQVVDYDGRPIPGLYAAGNAASSPFGTAYPGGGATLGAAVTFGRIAGRCATGG